MWGIAPQLYVSALHETDESTWWHPALIDPSTQAGATQNRTRYTSFSEVSPHLWNELHASKLENPACF